MPSNMIWLLTASIKRSHLHQMRMQQTSGTTLDMLHWLEGVCVCVCVCVCVVLYGYVNLCAFVLCVYSMCVLAEDLVLYASKVQRCAHTCVCLVL